MRRPLSGEKLVHVTLNELLFSLSKGLDYVEQDLLGITTNHGKRVALVSMVLGEALGLPGEEVFDLAASAVLHDNALTMYMRDVGPTNYASLEMLQQHCPLGEANVKHFPFLGDAAGLILYHHENWDGSGYYALSGHDIPLRAAIIRLADNMDLALHMGTARPGMQSLAQDHVRSLTRKVYSPRAAEALLDTFTDPFADSLADGNIDCALAGAVPAVGRDLSSKELLDTCRVFATIIDAKSRFTQTHSAGVAAMTRYMGGVFGLDEGHCDKLEVVALLHDVGKLAVPLSLLEKPGALEPGEYELVRKHAEISGEILGGISGLEDIAKWASRHHEKLDGSGYPSGSKGEELGFETRLLAACDIFSALMEDRPYRKAMDYAAASGILREMAAKGELDGDIVERMIVEMA